MLEKREQLPAGLGYCAAVVPYSGARLPGSEDVGRCAERPQTPRLPTMTRGILTQVATGGSEVYVRLQATYVLGGSASTSASLSRWITSDVPVA